MSHCAALRRALLLVLFLLVAPTVHSAILPITDYAQFGPRKVYMGGALGCLTSGTYNPQSMVWTQSGPCGENFAFFGADRTLLHVVGFDAELVGLVDHSGSALGGLFALFGSIPELGMSAPALLMRGTLIDANYGPAGLFDFGMFGYGANALIELDFALPVFGNAGDILLWESNARISGWDLAPGQAPWQSPAGAGSYHNWTNTQYMIYDRRLFFAPEPGMLALSGVGIAGLIGVLVGGGRRPGRRSGAAPALTPRRALRAASPAIPATSSEVATATLG